MKYEHVRRKFRKSLRYYHLLWRVKQSVDQYLDFQAFTANCSTFIFHSFLFCFTPVKTSSMFSHASFITSAFFSFSLQNVAAKSQSFRKSHPIETSWNAAWASPTMDDGWRAGGQHSSGIRAHLNQF